MFASPILPPTRPIIISITVTIDGVTVVSAFGGWAVYDHQAKRWFAPDRIKALVSA